MRPQHLSLVSIRLGQPAFKPGISPPFKPQFSSRYMRPRSFASRSRHCSRMMRAGFISRSHVKLIFIIFSVPACLYISSSINHFISIRTASVPCLEDKDRRQLWTVSEQSVFWSPELLVSQSTLPSPLKILVWHQNNPTGKPLSSIMNN